MRTLRILTLLLCAFAVGSCAQTRTVKTKIYEDRRMAVELHRVVGRDTVPLAKGRSHPAQFKIEDLKYLLGAISYREKGLFGWSDVRSVFTADELYRLAPHLVEAFAKATPDDEVLFRLTTAKPGAFFSSERYTDGRLFVKDKGLNCLFANVNIKPRVTDIYDGDPRNYYSGVLWSLVERDWQGFIVGEKGTHYNWIELDWERGLAEKKLREQALREKLMRHRAIKSRRRSERTGWEDWEPDTAIDHKTGKEEDVYFPPPGAP